MANVVQDRLPTHSRDSDVAAIGRAVNRLVARVNALLAKMDADFADVTNASTDYAATINGTGDNALLTVVGLDADPYDPTGVTT